MDKEENKKSKMQLTEEKKEAGSKKQEEESEKQEVRSRKQEVGSGSTVTSCTICNQILENKHLHAIFVEKN